MISILTGSDLCVFVFVLQTGHILFLVDFKSTCLVHASRTFYVCLVLYFLFAFADCMIAFYFCKRPGPMNGRKHLCKAWHNIYMCVCLFLYSLFAYLQIACLLLSFLQKTNGRKHLGMLDITFSAPFHKNNAFTTQYNRCMKYHQ